MRILLITDYGAPVGGAEAQVLGLRKNLRKRGHDARLFASTAYNSQNQADYTCLGTTSSFRTLLQSANLSAWLRLRKVLNEFRPDVAHVTLFLTQLSPLILPLLKDTPSLYYAAWYRAVCPTGTKILPNGEQCTVSAGWICHENGCVPLRDIGPLMAQMKLWKSRRNIFRLFTANSEAVKAELEREGIHPIQVIPPGVPEQKQRAKLQQPPQAAFAGRLVAEKGVDVLLHAFADVRRNLPQCRLLIAGDGPERKTLIDLSIHLGLQDCVSFLGHVPREKLEESFQDVWVQVVPSRWAEPFGLVAAESMMRGTAVIASNIGGLRELVNQNETGLLVPPQNPGVLGEAILRVFQNHDLCERMGENARRFALNELNDELFADRILAVYERLIDRKL